MKSGKFLLLIVTVQEKIIKERERERIKKKKKAVSKKENEKMIRVSRPGSTSAVGR